MKVAILSDIHGNHYALEQVLNEASKIGVGKLLVLGDIVGYYYRPEVVLELLSKWPYEIIKGNHEMILKDLHDGKINSNDLKRKYGNGHEQALKRLDSSQCDWLFTLPQQKTVVIDGVSFQMNHGSPWSIDEYLYPNTSTDLLEKCDSLEHDFVLIGHSHYSFSFQCKHSILINSGSVGQSREKGGLAYWSIVDTHNKSFEIYKTKYDTASLLKEVYKLDHDFEYSAKVLIR